MDKKKKMKKAKKASVGNTQAAATTTAATTSKAQSSTDPAVNMKLLCESVLNTLTKPETSEVKLTSNMVRVHKLLCGEDEPRYMKHWIGLSIIRGQIMLVPTEHSTTLIEIRSNEASSRRLTKLCLMDMGASSLIISLKVIQEIGVAIY